MLFARSNAASGGWNISTLTSGAKISCHATLDAVASRAADVSFDFSAASIAGWFARRKPGKLGDRNASMRKHVYQCRRLQPELIARVSLPMRRGEKNLKPTASIGSQIAAPGNFSAGIAARIPTRQKSIVEIIIASAPHFFIQPTCQINYTVCKMCRVELHESIGGDKHGSKEKSRETRRQEKKVVV